jgi:hypothetical protein
MKTAHQRQEEKRQVKFAEMEEQIKAGKLVVRKMTAEERKRFPPRNLPRKRRAR